MCGRFTLRAAPEAVADHFELDEPPQSQARYNIAPGQAVDAIRVSGSARICDSLLWGLVPSWAADPSVGSRMINARVETIAEKPAFRSAIRKRRCLIPADGFYEWAGESAPKQPYHIARSDGGLFGFAGLWASWRSEAGRELNTCTIVTTEANAALRAIHRRMPVIVGPGDYADWLDPDQGDVELLRGLLARGADTPLALSLIHI